ncbi:MAG: peptidyl-prolyl cis-trans isomerase [Planctomycetes bacterium]|nr:peptidyl-prolyl cis-trans isomerase [Planctomycetota bacterium]
MEAANPLCRLLLLAFGLAAVIGCRSDAGAKARGQMPQDPLAPVAPPPMPPPGTPATFTPIAPLTPGAPVPVQPVQGTAPATAGAAVPGSPVPASAKVVNTGYAPTPKAISPAELLKNGTPRVKVIAIVGRDNVITDQEVIESVWQHNEELIRLEGHAREAKQKELYTDALRKTIERELVLDEMYAKLKKANKMQLIEEIKESAVQAADRQIREMKKKIGCKTDEELNTWLRVQGLTLAVFRRQFERTMMSQQYIGSMLKEKGRKVGLAEIRDYYDRHPEEFRSPDRVWWQHVFVSAAKHPTARAAYDHAEAIRQRAAAGTDLGALSKQFDDGVAGKQHGFGVGESRGEILPADVEPTVWALKPGGLSGVIQTPTGFHVVKVVERDYAGVTPFDAKVQSKIRDKLNDAIYDAEAKKMVDELWRKGVVWFPNAEE